MWDTSLDSGSHRACCLRFCRRFRSLYRASPVPSHFPPPPLFSSSRYAHPFFLSSWTAERAQENVGAGNGILRKVDDGQETPTRPRDSQRATPLAEDVNGHYVASLTTPQQQFINQETLTPIIPQPKPQKTLTKKMPPPATDPHPRITLKVTLPPKSAAEGEVKREKKEKRPKKNLTARKSPDMNGDITTLPDGTTAPGQHATGRATLPAKARNEDLQGETICFSLLSASLASASPYFCCSFSPPHPESHLAPEMIFKEFLVIIEGIIFGGGGYRVCMCVWGGDGGGGSWSFGLRHSSPPSRPGHYLTPFSFSDLAFQMTPL